MKTRDFEKILVEKGYVLISNGPHKKWSKDNHTVMVVHGKEMNIFIVKRLLKEIEKQRFEIRNAA
jgi:predicted RNA binding protein YcfA (HicA-like mRNA interferase family)